MGIWYITRESVKRALDSAETARNDGEVDRAIDAASRSVEGLTHRTFYPEIATRYYRWPDPARARSWRLWLTADLLSVSALTSGGVTIPPADFFLEPNNYGPPYNVIEIDQASTAAFSAGATSQRAVSVTGEWGASGDEAPAGALAEALDAVETAVDVTNAGAVGVGDLLRCGTERMIVSGRSMLTTGQTLQTPVTASTADVLFAVTTGSAYNVNEVLLLDAERVLVVDIAGNNLVVKRAWDGSVLASHTGSTIYAARTLTVTRGVLGTTAATHDTAAALYANSAPALVQELTLAETINSLQQASAGYGVTVSAGEGVREATGGGLGDLRQRCYVAFGRKARMGVI